LGGSLWEGHTPTRLNGRRADTRTASPSRITPIADLTSSVLRSRAYTHVNLALTPGIHVHVASDPDLEPREMKTVTRGNHDGVIGAQGDDEEDDPDDAEDNDAEDEDEDEDDGRSGWSD